jgi:ribosomal protein L7Ae-like RNA K-turn-binding protein
MLEARMALFAESRYESRLRKLALSCRKRRSTNNLKIPGRVDAIPTIGQLLLSDIHQVFLSMDVEKLRTVRLIPLLCTDSSMHWATFRNGKELNARTLNTILRNEFCLHSKDIRFSKRRVFKGFQRKTIDEVWSSTMKNKEAGI